MYLTFEKKLINIIKKHKRYGVKYLITISITNNTIILYCFKKRSLEYLQTHLIACVCKM